MTDFIVAAVVMLVIGMAVTYLMKEKKKGKVCIGCPDAEECSKKGSSGSGCSCH